MEEFLTLFLERREELFSLFLEHMNMTVAAVLISLAIGIPLGIAVLGSRRAAAVVIGFANVLQSIPSIALLAFAVPFVGIGARAAILMVIVYALLPILKSTYVGLKSVDPKLVEAARGIGMGFWKRLLKVELPIAAPAIMSGVRISAVASVGTMTIAAFAGAGGLGWFINLGLNSQNAGLVLLGAIPASLLALGLDYLLGKLESVLTPQGLLPPAEIKNEPPASRRRRAVITGTVSAAILAAPACISMARALSKKGARPIVVASSNFTESIILGYLIEAVIRAKSDVPVERRFNLSGGVMCFSALKAGEVDIFPTYTGSIIPNYLKLPLPSTDPKTAYEFAKHELDARFGIALSKPLGFSNTYVMAVSPEVAKRYGLSTLADLMREADHLRLGCTVEFVQRSDCLPALEKAFGGAKFEEVRGLDSSLRYQALAAGEVDVIDAFSTDGLLERIPNVLLKDATHFFPPYDCMLIERPAAFEGRPEVLAALKLLEGAVTEADMRRMNSRVDLEGVNAREAAHEFLLKKGIATAEELKRVEN